MTEKRHSDPLPYGGADGLPYSKGVMARALIATGVRPSRAYELALRIEYDLLDRHETIIELDRMHELAVEILGEDEGAQAVRQLRRYRDLRELDLPIIVLVAGATGTGKSTVATEVAHRLGITRVTSTDFVRQTMRAFFSKDFMPAIHYSSFEADRALRSPEDAEQPVLAGFLEQARNVLVGVQAALDRSLEEGWSMVLEGVHLIPGFMPTSIDGALVVQCVLAVQDEERHAGHFYIRDATTDGVRPMAKYLSALDHIRLIQDYLIRRAGKYGVPVIDNVSVEESIGAVMELVLTSAEQLEKAPA